MKGLDNKYMAKLFHYWRNKEKKEVVIISEIYSTNLRNFILKAEKLRITAIRKWSLHILNGLKYLHGLDKPVIHRNLRCGNIFIKGNGHLKIGNFYFAITQESGK